MEEILQLPILKTLLEDEKIFMGIYDVRNKFFLYINEAGLKKLKVSNLQQFNSAYPHGFRKNKLSSLEHEDLEKDLLKNKIWKGELPFEIHDGVEFWAELEIQIFNQSNQVYYLIKVFDTTLIKQKDQKILDEENRFEALFRHAAIGIIVVDRASKIILCNHFADILFGYSKDELLGQNLEVLIPHNVREKHQKTYETFTDNPKARAMGAGLNLKGKRKDETLFSVEISLSNFKIDEEPYFIAFINDITFKRKAEEELLNRKSEIEKLNENLENEVIHRTNALVDTLKKLEKSKLDLEHALLKEKELGELKSRFVSMASHEFRTPLTTIQSAATLIEKYKNTDDQAKRESHTKRILSAVGNLTDILEEFLSVGKLEDGKIEATYSTFDVEDLVNDCKMDLKSLLKTGQSIQFTLNGVKEVFLDKSLIRKIIINLCSNSIKFSAEQMPVELQIDNSPDKLLLKVKDYGVGISDEDKKNLFGRFFRGANALNIQGTGLGLHIVARYVELMNGKIEVESELNKGTTISVEI